MPAPRRMTAAERKVNATRKEPVAPKRTPKVTVQEAPPCSPRLYRGLRSSAYAEEFRHV
jgi:hypothetical protein